MVIHLQSTRMHYTTRSVGFVKNSTTKFEVLTDVRDEEVTSQSYQSISNFGQISMIPLLKSLPQLLILIISDPNMLKDTRLNQESCLHSN